MTPELPDIDDLADMLLPVDGPHTRDGVLAAAGLVSELVRRLNHATLPTRSDRTLPYPSTVDSVVGRLGGAAGGLAQLLGQLAHRLDSLALDPRLYDDRGVRVEATPLETATTAAAILEAEAVVRAEALVRVLNVARSHTNHLGVRESAPSTEDGDPE